MNTFDIVVSAALAISLVAGFHTGLLRSLASILGYVAAAPIALWASSHATLTANSPTQTFAVFMLVLFAAGLMIGHMLKVSIRETFGTSIDIFDRVIGAAFGGLRVGLIGLTLVMVFDRIIPPNHQPGFLKGSAFRPLFSAVGQQGLRSLPPDLIATIDKVKSDRRL